MARQTYVVWTGRELATDCTERQARKARAEGAYVTTTAHWTADLAREAYTAQVSRRRKYRITRDAALWTAQTQTASHFPAA